MTSTGEAVIFWILGPLMVIAALGLLFARKAVHAALCVAFVMVNLGVLYIVQQADFLGIVQIFVYTGAVMMFFLFVLMLVGVDSSDSLIETHPRAEGGGHRALPRPGAGDVLRAGLAHAVRAQVRSTRSTRTRQRQRRRRADLRQVRLGLRADLRPAHHRRAGRDGPRPPRADRREAVAEGLVAAPRSARTSSSPACRSPVCMRGTTPSTPRPCSRTAPDPAVGVAGPAVARPDRRPRTPTTPPSRPSRTRSRRGRSDEPRPLHLPLDDPLRDRRGRGPVAAQRDHRVHGRRADAQRDEPRLRDLRPRSTAPSTARSSPCSSWSSRPPRSSWAWPSSWPSSAPAGRPRSTTPTS